MEKRVILTDGGKQCGYDEYGNLHIIRTLCSILNMKFCLDKGYNCSRNCPLRDYLIADRDKKLFKLIVDNYDSFFENFFLYVVEKFSKLILYFSSDIRRFMYLKGSRFRSDPYVNALAILSLEQKIREACRLVLFSPYKSLSEENICVPVWLVKRVSDRVILNTLKEPRNLSKEKELFPFSRMIQFRKVETLDNYENRVVKFILSVFILDNLKKSLGRFNKSKSIYEKLKKFIGWLEEFLNRNFWLGVGIESPINIYSQVLLKKAGYRDLIEIYYLLQRAVVPSLLVTGCDDQILKLKRMDKLWEYYCFTVILSSLKMMGYRLSGPIRFEERKYRDDNYEYAKIELISDGKLVLTFQKFIEINEKERMPDFQIVFGDKCLIMDAKFRVSRNLYPCELEKYFRRGYWKNKPGKEELADVCLGLTVRNEKFDDNYLYRAVAYGDFSKNSNLYRGWIESEKTFALLDKNRINEEKIKEVIEKFLISNLSEYRGRLGYVPLDIPTVPRNF